MSVTYHVVVPFDRSPEGELVPGEARESPNADRAKRQARALAATHAGAIAFSRTGMPDTGAFEDGVVTAIYGEVDLSALQA